MNGVFEKIIEKLEERASFLSDCTKYGNKDAKQQNKSYSTMMMYEVADLVDDLVEIVKQAAAEYNNGWIPCSSGNLPDALEDVLIDMGGTKPIPAYIHNREWYLTDCRGSSEKVKDQSRVEAWHPLPEPYQTEGE